MLQGYQQVNTAGANIDAQFAQRRAATESALKQSLAAIDDDAAKSIGNLQRTIQSLGKDAEDTGQHVRTGTAPIADYSKVAKSGAADASAFANAQEKLQDIIDRAKGVLDPVAAAWSKYVIGVRAAAEAGGKEITLIQKHIEYGVTEAQVQDHVAEAVNVLTEARNRELAAIKQKQDIVTNVLTDMQKEVDLTGLSEKAHFEMEATLKAEAQARDNLKPVCAKARR